MKSALRMLIASFVSLLMPAIIFAQSKSVTTTVDDYRLTNAAVREIQKLAHRGSTRVRRSLNPVLAWIYPWPSMCPSRIRITR